MKGIHIVQIDSYKRNNNAYIKLYFRIIYLHCMRIIKNKSCLQNKMNLEIVTAAEIVKHFFVRGRSKNTC